MPLRVAFIGAGSVGFTRRLSMDLMMVPELQDTTFALHDIDEKNLGMVKQLLQKDIDANELPAKIEASTDRRRSLEGADYVVNCTRIGGLEAFAHDIDVPLKYGVDQCVGDTLCAGGLMYAQRNIPQILAFSRDAKEVGNDGCLLLNYANPMAMNTWAGLDAADRGEGVPIVGLCHGVRHGWFQIDEVLANLHGEPKLKLSDPAWARRTQVDCAGINHQTWYVKIIHHGREVGGAELLEAFEAHEGISETERIRIDVLRRTGFYSTESSGHLSEYLPWYRKSPEDVRNWVSMNSWINGETGGYLRVCTEGRNWFETDFPKWLDQAGEPIADWERSAEHGSYIIEALETNRPYRGHFNVRNTGVITNLPADCVIEAPGYVDATGIHMKAGITLPQQCAATCNASVAVQRMGKDAALTGDATLLKQAMLHDPLTAAVTTPPEVWQMADELLVALREWLPQYDASVFEAAAKRLENPPVETRENAGAARKKVQTIEELRAGGDSRGVLKADKGEDRDEAA